MAITTCNVNGLPGFKGSATGKCHVYAPGDDRGKEAAMDRARNDEREAGAEGGKTVKAAQHTEEDKAKKLPLRGDKKKKLAQDLDTTTDGM